MTSEVVINLLTSFCDYVLIAINFAVVYRVILFFHFAHAVVFTSGVYFTFLLYKFLCFSIPLAIIFTYLLGYKIE